MIKLLNKMLLQNSRMKITSDTIKLQSILTDVLMKLLQNERMDITAANNVGEHLLKSCMMQDGMLSHILRVFTVFLANTVKNH